MYCHSVTADHFSRVDQFANTHSGFWNASPTNVVHLAQSKLENILRKEWGASDSPHHIILGYDAVNLVTSSSGSHITARKSTVDGIKGSQQLELHCKYLIGADGASSFVRRSLGIAMEGEANMQSLINVHFTCRGLEARLKPRPAMLYFVYNEVKHFNLPPFAVVMSLAGDGGRVRDARLARRRVGVPDSVLPSRAVSQGLVGRFMTCSRCISTSSLAGLHRRAGAGDSQGWAGLDGRRRRGAADRGEVREQLGYARGGGRPVLQRPRQRLPGRRRGAQVPSCGWLRHEHRHPGRAQPRVEAGLGARRGCRSGSARHIWFR